MLGEDEGPDARRRRRMQTPSNLPYVFVSREFMSEEWKVVSADRTPANGVIRLPLHGTGEFRAYVKEPGVDFTPGDQFVIPQHALAEGGDSGREVQPWLCLTVHTGTTNDNWALDQQLPNAFERAATDYPAAANATLTKVHTDQGINFTIGAFEEGQLVGTVGFYREMALKLRHKGYLVSMYVTPEYRSRGIARTLLIEAIAGARRLPDLKQLLLGVVVTQTTARRLYESLGFVAYGREPDAVKIGDEYFDEEFMVLKL